MSRKFIHRVGAAFAAVFVLAMAVNPLIAVAITSPDTGNAAQAQMHCADHSCCRKGHHPPAPASQTQVRSSCCGGACCAFGQIVILKLGYALAASPQIGISFAEQQVVRTATSRAVLAKRDTSMFQRPPPSFA